MLGKMPPPGHFKADFSGASASEDPRGRVGAEGGICREKAMLEVARTTSPGLDRRGEAEELCAKWQKELNHHEARAPSSPLPQLSARQQPGRRPAAGGGGGDAGRSW